MKNIGIGLKRTNNESQQRVKCEVLGINQYRLKDSKVEYQVFWKGTTSDIEMSWETIQYLQQCKEEIQRVVAEKKTKGIYKKRSAFPILQNRHVFQSHQKQKIQNPTNFISLISDLDNSSQAENVSKSIPSEEGEIKLQYSHYNHVPINEIKESQKNQYSQKLQQFEQNQLQINNYQPSDSQFGVKKVKKNEKDEKPIFYFNETSQNHQQVESTFQASEKIQSQDQSRKQKQPQKSISLSIYKQISCQVSFIPKVSKKPFKETITEASNPKQKLNIRRNLTNIHVEPEKKEDVLVSKLIRDGNKILFEILVFNEDGRLIPQRISSQQLRVKAPYALLKFYESRIIR